MNGYLWPNPAGRCGIVDCQVENPATSSISESTQTDLRNRAILNVRSERSNILKILRYLHGAG